MNVRRNRSSSRNRIFKDGDHVMLGVYHAIYLHKYKENTKI